MNHHASILYLIQSLGQLLYDKKACNILALDLEGCGAMTEAFLIANGNSKRHVQGLTKAIEEYLREQNIEIDHREGAEEGDWIVLDCASFVIHLFTEEMRNRYRLEELWQMGELVDLQITVGDEE